MSISPTTRAWLLDTAERTARTFVQGFLSVVSINGISDSISKIPDTNLSIWTQLEIGALAGLFAILTAFAGKAVGSPRSASFLK
jgi:hypothetical protein